MYKKEKSNNKEDHPTKTILSLNKSTIVLFSSLNEEEVKREIEVHTYIQVLATVHLLTVAN